jgi:hypothetical protein
VPKRTFIRFKGIPSMGKPQIVKNLGLANNIGADGKTGSTRGFGFRGALRLHRTTPAVDPVTEPEEFALGNKLWNTDRVNATGLRR